MVRSNKKKKGQAQNSSSIGSNFSSDSCQASGSSGRDIKVRQINDSLYVLKDPEPPVTPQMDIVFFHGFHSSDSSDAHLRTWEVLLEDGPCIWPSTWLAETFPKARVLYVSYNAVLGKSSQGKFDLHIIAENLVSDFMQARIGQAANCPVALVGHCFGGLVIKQLCLHISKNVNLVRLESQRVKLQNFILRLKGVFYYGTPHRGSPCAEQARDLESSPLLKYFKILSTEASRMNSDFSHLCTVHDEWHIQGLGESLPTKQGLFQGVIVAPEACSRNGDEFNVVAADHVSITKPESKTDRRFYALTSHLHRITTNTKVEVLGHQCQGLPDFPMELGNFAQEVEEELEGKAILGIVGMGGIGKTTIAKQAYNNISSKFEYTCFLENVKMFTSNALQDAVCSHFYQRGKIVGKIQWEDLKKKKTLIVMDDVDCEDQLAVLPKLHHLGDGSRILITSRNREILGFYEKHGVYEVSFLKPDMAKRLFCRHAFGIEVVPAPASQTKHLEDVTKVVAKCGGLPLTLEVMGRYLRNHRTNAKIWKETIKRLGNAQAVTGDRNDRVWASLQVSYDALTEGEQEMFIEAGTIFSEKPLKEALAAWSTFIDTPEISWANLTNRSMVKENSRTFASIHFIDKMEKTIKVHEQLQDLAKKLGKGPSIDAWGEAADKLVTELHSNKVNENTVYLSLHGTSTPLQLDTLVWLKNLRYLQFSELSYEGSAENFPNNLLTLDWSSGTPWNTSPSLFPISVKGMNNLAHLELSRWDVGKGFSKALGSLTNLRILRLEDITGLGSLSEDLGNLIHLKELILVSVRLSRLPDSLGKLLALEHLLLKDVDCRELPESFGDLSSLVRVHIERCEKLSSLPASFGRGLESLKILFIADCPLLECLPHSFSQLRELEELVIDMCFGLKELGDAFGDLFALQQFTLSECLSIERLPKSIGRLTSLQKLVIDCFSLAKLPNELGHLKSLQQLMIKSFSLKRLPRSLGDMAGLKSLTLITSEVKHLPDSLGKLSSVLETLSITAESLESLPNSIGQLSSLRKLFINCDCLKEVPESLCDLSSLESLYIGSKRLKDLPERIGRLQSVRTFCLKAESFQTLPESIGQLTSLQELELIFCEKLERLPNSLHNLALSSLCLGLYGETISPTVLMGLGNLSKLGKLELGSFTFRRLPEEIEKLSSLESLSLFGCSMLESLPDSLGSISCLREMVLEDCAELKTLPNSLGRPLSSQVALPREQGMDEETTKPLSEPKVSEEGLRLEIRKCPYLEESLMRSWGWVQEFNLEFGGKEYRREKAIPQAA